MEKVFYSILLFVLGCITVCSCEEDEVVFSPSVPYRIEFGDSLYHKGYQNGDSLYGRIIVIEDSLIKGTNIKKIDCRLGNIVIGCVENKKVCPFGVRLKEKPAGIHTFSVIIKCKAPDCDETFWRYDSKMITIKE